ncbi:CUB and Sushi multiple domains 1 L homeolog [Xenopus laevis]|uniref:CUB and Sushi multiple domains 1 L homeolog n=1 Tax=Xenopus laevis TaxID=8355 RepID=A9UM12_XENLA|nr:CUB and Sushi multiple domains 1 L homeolog [Xenopus laevis]AAI57482.1 LOC100137671 protein [Xenopus laevis]
MGERNVFCTENGTWSNPPPKCIDVNCPNPVVPNSKKLSGFMGPYKLNYAVRFECHKGLQMKGSDTITCGIDSQWKPQIPSCLHVNCPNPVVPNSKKLAAFMGPYKLNDIVRFECLKGFAMQGSDTITCSIDSQWKPEIPSCLYLNCPSPHVPHSKMLSKLIGPYLPNSTLRFQCVEGFSMYGSDTVMCSSEGVWEPLLPRCLDVNCPNPVVPNSKKLSGFIGPYKLNYAVRFECLEGLQMKGSDIITCGIHGQWKPQIPSCLREACPEPVVPHGIIKKPENILTVTSEGYSVGQKVKIECDFDFGLNRHHILTCGSDLHWYPSISVCHPKHFCTEPKVFHGQIKNGTPVYLINGVEKGYNVGDVIKVKCDYKHHLKGKNSIFCGSDMKWHPRIPICEHRLGCSYPEIKNGLIVLRNGDAYNPKLNFSFFLGDTVRVKCRPGFGMYGNESSKCSGYFEWSPDLPVCVQGNKHQ